MTRLEDTAPPKTPKWRLLGFASSEARGQFLLDELKKAVAKQNAALAKKAADKAALEKFRAERRHAELKSLAKSFDKLDADIAEVRAEIEDIKRRNRIALCGTESSAFSADEIADIKAQAQKRSKPSDPAPAKAIVGPGLPRRPTDEEALPQFREAFSKMAPTDRAAILRRLGGE